MMRGSSRGRDLDASLVSSLGLSCLAAPWKSWSAATPAVGSKRRREEEDDREGDDDEEHQQQHTQTRKRSALTPPRPAKRACRPTTPDPDSDLESVEDSRVQEDSGLLTPLKRAFHVSKSFVAALFASPGDLRHISDVPDTQQGLSRLGDDSLAVGPSISESHAVEEDGPVHIDLTGDTDNEESDRSVASIESEESAAEDFSDQVVDEEPEVDEIRLADQRKAADIEWADKLNRAAAEPPLDLHFELRRAQERDSTPFLGIQRTRSRRAQQRADRRLKDSSVSPSSSSTPIIDYFIEKSFRHSPSPMPRKPKLVARPYDPDYSNSVDEAEEAIENLSLSSPVSRTNFGHLELYLAQSIAKLDSRKRVYEHNETYRQEAIGKSLGDLQEKRTTFEEAFAQLRAAAERKRLEKERAKWLAEDRRAFTPEEQALVAKIIRGKTAEVLVTGFNSELTRQDLQRLRDTEWLNDEVINFYLNLLKQRSDANKNQAGWPKCHFMNTFFYPLLTDKGGYNYSRVQKWTRRVDIFAMDLVIVPIHLGNHWCLAVINIRDRRFEYYDSLGGSNRECLQRLRRYVQDEARDKKKIELDLSEWTDHQPKDIPMQKNGYDCGVFASKFAECLATNRPFYFSQASPHPQRAPVDMPVYRKRMIVSILNKKIC